MGGHYGSIHVCTEDAAAVRVALEELSREHGTKFLIAPPLGGWITAFPHENGQDFQVSEALAGKIGFPLLHCLVHDDDVFSYQFFERGTLVDTYNSCPEYFGGEPAPRGGNVELLQSILPDAAKRAELRLLLEADRPGFEVERLEKFSALLGLPNAVSAYEYLQDGERAGIRQWKHFVHIPDLTAEKTAKRAAKAKAKADLKQLAKDGVLMLEIVGQKTSHPFYSAPVWCIDPNTSDALLAWTGSSMGPATPTRLARVNVQTGRSTETGVVVSDHARCMAASSTKPWLAVGCASGDWKTEIWNWENGKLVADIAQSRAVEQVCFSRDGQTLFSLSEKTITVVELSGTGDRKAIHLAEGGRRMALHPAGDFLAVESEGMLAVVHLKTGMALKRLWIPEPPGPRRDLLEHVLSAGMDQQILSSLEGHVSKEELESARERMARHSLPKQSIFSLSFGPSGNYLFCGTTAGVCVLEWEKILDAADLGSIAPLAFVRAEQLVRDDGLPDRQIIYATPVDPVAKRVLFAGLEGKVRFASLSDGQIGDLLAPPVRMPFWHLELTPDRTSLVGTAIPRPRGRGQPEPSSFQIWNYKALCEAAGLAW